MYRIALLLKKKRVQKTVLVVEHDKYAHKMKEITLYNLQKPF